MTRQQVYLLLGIPLLGNAVFIGLLMAYINAKTEGLRAEMNERFASMNQRFDDMRDLWRAELHRVEEVLDARLKHLEER